MRTRGTGRASVSSCGVVESSLLVTLDLYVSLAVPRPRLCSHPRLPRHFGPAGARCRPTRAQRRLARICGSRGRAAACDERPHCRARDKARGPLRRATMWTGFYGAGAAPLGVVLPRPHLVHCSEASARKAAQTCRSRRCADSSNHRQRTPSRISNSARA